MKSYLGDIPNPTLRDFQRKKLYQAERTCGFWNNLQTLSSRRVKALVKDIGSWANIDLPKISYASHKNARTVAYATAVDLVLPFPLAKSVPFICHEMSHVINYQRGPADHHGPNFASAYLEVVNEFVGQKGYEELKESFRRYKVKCGEVIHI
tara:strand:+ start:2078 stop:2533 length:456 start_codon:yes stop_codon:yes gene_type:complete